MLNFFGRALFALGLASLPAGAAAAQVKIVLDTTYNEGSPFKITATVAANVSYFWWSVVEGYNFKIFDPESKTLGGTLPRVSKADFIRFRFSAKIKDSVTAQDIIIRIRDDAPDPSFSFAPPLSWNGATTVDVKPAIGNLAQIKTCRFPTLRYSWYAESVPVDTALRDSSMVLKSASADGILALKLCLDNGGAAICKAANVLVKMPVVSIPLLPRDAQAAARKGATSPFWRADGRPALPGAGPTVAFPGILITR